MTQSPAKKRMTGRPTTAANTNMFVQHMKRRENGDYLNLNRTIAAALKKADAGTEPNDSLEQLADEYVRQSTLLDQIYRNEGVIMGMGNDESNQLGLTIVSVDDKSGVPPTLYNTGVLMRQVSAGGVHSIALSTDFIPYTWGTSEEGALGRTVNRVNERKPTPVTGFRRRDTKVVEDGKIVQIAAGDAHSLFLSVSGAVYQCGKYRDAGCQVFCDAGEDGNVRTKNFTPVHVDQIPGPAIAIYTRDGVNAALLADHSLVTWGFGNYGELARSAGMTKPDAYGKYDVAQTFAYKQERDEEGELYDEPDIDIIKEHFLTPKPVIWQSNPKLKRIVISVGVGVTHLVVAARDPGQLHGKVYTSGVNSYGQLGHGDDGKDTTRHELTLVEALLSESIGQVAAGQEFTLALTLDRQRLYSFGRAEVGQLGIGQTVPTVGCIAFFNTPQLVKFPEPVNILDINAGSNHAMALSEQHELYTWGAGGDGATGFLDNECDIFRPRKLDLTKHVKSEDISHCHVVGMDGGSLHSLVLAKFFRRAA